jgi:carboxylesterase
MGSLLTLHLAAQHPDLPGVIIYSPAVWTATSKIYLTPIARHFVAFQPKPAASDLMDPQADRQLWCYDVDPVGAAAELLKLILDVRRSLRKVVCPVIIFHSTRDAAIHPASAQRTFERIGAPDKQLMTLHKSGHCITVDAEWEYVAERTYDFIVGHGG